MVAGSRLRMKHFFVVLLPELPSLFFLINDPSTVDNTQGRGLVDDLELLSFEAFGFLQLISFQEDLFRRFALDLQLFVPVGKCLQLCLRDCVKELGFSSL